MLDMMKMRNTGMLEMVDSLLGHSLYFFDIGHLYINSNASDKRDRTLKPAVCAVS